VALAKRICGSMDLYGDASRHPYHSLNFITCHDGFTLNDLVSYNVKHNEANGEDNRDGMNENYSWNCGVEGPSSDPAILRLRWRQARNLFATMMLSQGVPMILAGDEFLRTQKGNNNAWCQDNELSWFDWDLDAPRERLLAFTRRLVELRRRHPVFRRTRFLDGHSADSGLPDAWWFRPDGRQMNRHDWDRSDVHVVGLFLNGQEIGSRTPEGEPVVDDSFLLLLNARAERTAFTLPPLRFGGAWEVELETADPDAPAVTHPARGEVVVEGRALVLLRRTNP
jgi:glycogen operon protein